VVSAALTVIGAAFPGAHPNLTAETVAVWHDAVQGYNADHVLIAARELATTSEKFPTLTTFLSAVQGVARRFSTQSRPALPSGTPHSEVARAVLNLQRKYTKNSPPHRHRHGAENCPSCSTREQRAREFEAEAQQMFEDLRDRGFIHADVEEH
jgi:hypothetical protein